eukprot:1391927-Amorphochlora_amoeboformis.AAC.2
MADRKLFSCDKQLKPILQWIDGYAEKGYRSATLVLRSTYKFFPQTSLLYQSSWSVEHLCVRPVIPSYESREAICVTSLRIRGARVSEDLAVLD